MTADVALEVSVVVPVRNGAATLREQLGALACQHAAPPFEVVIADNRSTDGTADVARAWADRVPGLRVVRAADRDGINYARNTGAAAAVGDLILFCDADDVVGEGWVAAMAAAGRDGCDLLGGRVETGVVNPPAVAASRDRYPQDRLPVALDFLPFAVGANCGVRRQVLDDLGGFDEAYVRGGADVEFFWRAQLASYRLCFVPDAVVHYRYREGLRPLARQFFRYGMADVQLYRRFRDHGLRRPPLARTVRGWWWLFRHVPDLLRSPSRRAKWLRRTAYRAGRVRGSLRQRVVLL